MKERGFKVTDLCTSVQLTDSPTGAATSEGKKKAYRIFDAISNKVLR